jgi:hypothetical protein
MQRLALVFFIVVTVFVYLGLRLSAGLGAGLWICLGIFTFGIFLYPMSWYWRGREPSLLRAALVNFALLDMALMSFILSLTILRDLIFWPFQFFAPSIYVNVFSAEGSLVTIGGSIFALCYGSWVVARGPKIIEVSVPIRNLPKALEGFKIAQISDLHVGPMIGLKYVRHVVDLIKKLQPDLTVLTGDIADAELDHYSAAVQPLSELGPDAYFVPGNHEYYWNGPRWIRHFESLGLKPLLNSNIWLKHNGEP